jgi:hypothetical protein
MLSKKVIDGIASKIRYRTARSCRELAQGLNLGVSELHLCPVTPS